MYCILYIYPPAPPPPQHNTHTHTTAHTPFPFLSLPVSYQENECDEYGTAAVVVYDIKSPKSKATQQIPSLLLSLLLLLRLLPSFLLLTSISLLSLLVWDVLAPIDQGQDHVAEGRQGKAQWG